MIARHVIAEVAPGLAGLAAGVLGRGQVAERLVGCGAGPAHPGGRGLGVVAEHAAKAFRGVLIFTAGACPFDEQGHVVAIGNVSAQMRLALQNLRIALEESGATISDVLKTTVYFASSDRSDLVTAWDEVAGFGDPDVPSTLLGVGTRASSSRSRPSRLRRRT